MAGRGRRYGATNGGGKGPGGPKPHPEIAGGVYVAGGGPEAAYFGGGELGTCREETVAGGDSGHGWSIPLTWR
jgi:hypothetical protein